MRRLRDAIENWPRWFAGVWPNAQRRWVVINSYRGLGTHHKEMLADIALRNHVFGPNREETDRMAWIAEGRRQCALEILKLARVDHDALYQLTVKHDRTGDRT